MADNYEDTEDIISDSGSETEEESENESEVEENVSDVEEQDEEQEVSDEEEENDAEEEDEEDDDEENIKGGSLDGDDSDDDDENNKKISKGKKVQNVDLNFDDDDNDEDDDENYLQKFNSEINRNYISDHHPECLINNYDEISILTQVVRDGNNNIIDDLHKTLPYLTKYEKARVLGQRAKQIEMGAKAFVQVPENVIDGYLIAQMELKQKRVPFIIRRPTHGGGCEYWNLKDLEDISF
jgi:DNA-directed RNA polymerase subunit K/omega